jgi:hypothetical protein
MDGVKVAALAVSQRFCKRIAALSIGNYADEGGILRLEKKFLNIVVNPCQYRTYEQILAVGRT